jgi:hypothetical protein
MTLFKIDETDSDRRLIYFDLRQADGVSPAILEDGGQPEVSINTSAWTGAMLIGTLTHIGNGRYYAELTATGVGTLGRIETRYKSANTLECPGDSGQVVAFDPYDATFLGISGIEAIQTVTDKLDTGLAPDGLSWKATAEFLADSPIGDEQFTSDDRATLNAILARITSVQVVIASGVDPDGVFTIYRTFDHDDATLQQIQITVSGLPDIDGIPVLEFADGTEFVTGDQSDLGGGQWRFDFNVEAIDTEGVAIGDSYVMRVRAFVGDKSRLAAELKMNVR